MSSAKEIVDSAVEDKKVVVFGAFYCPFCARTKALLKKANIPFTFVDVAFSSAQKGYLARQTGSSSFPWIFINQKSIGGLAELQALQASGELYNLIL
ncbi:UNVERIFIED_CONTAM: Glutaredoxin-1 [Siphonaria sp. JEL0065]|nr:Glutaredoxin-1 [Siphonaria sp. JEL0065]